MIQDVYNARKRRVAPSYGYDLVPVLAHAWRSWWLSTAEDALTLVLFGAAFLAFPLAALVAVLFLVDLGLAQALIARLSHRYRVLRADLEGDEKNDWSTPWSRLLGRALTVTAIVTVVALVLLVRLSGWPGVGAAALIGLVPCAVLAASGVLRQLALNRLRMRDTKEGSAPGPLRTSRRLSVIDGQQRHPMVVYSGGTPFVGSGKILSTWSFAQRLVEAKPLGEEKDVEFAQKPFTSWALVEELRRAITALGTESDPETRLPGLRVDDTLFVEGRYAGHYSSELGARPEAELVQRMLDSPPETARHYLTCQVESWGGDVVTTMFVHVSLQGRTLYIEFTTCGLAPTRLEYQVVDVVGGTGRVAVLRSAATSLRRLPAIATAPMRLARATAQLLGALQAGADATAAHLKRGLDIGAVFSARESASLSSDESYFQSFDVFKHSKIIERRLLSTVGDFLKEHGVDTSEFRRRASAILNNGVIHTGTGDINVDHTAMGENTSVNG
ncbi:hypothetical protein [Streptomyces sp. NBC_00996]|uniref:hypothetical protein n=1 Tax=Streptomyces sp. NBC_00996 TaxID=2903710 RepID=UPI0038655B3E|nr:hypothetical protein OG390_39890 [Streptomyces sp. NBC_00996]